MFDRHTFFRNLPFEIRQLAPNNDIVIKTFKLSFKLLFIIFFLLFIFLFFVIFGLILSVAL